MNRRQIFTSALGALALASGRTNNATAQTIPRPVGRRPPIGTATPYYDQLSQAVVNSHGLAIGNDWTGISTGTLKSDDLVRASLLLRLTADHFEEIGLTAHVDTQLAQLSQPLSGLIPLDVVHPIGDQLRSYGILLTDAQIQSMYSTDVNARGQALSYATQVGIRGVQGQIADSLDLAAKKLRLQEIATACGALLDVLPFAQSMQAINLSPQASASCVTWQILIDAMVAGALAQLGLGYLGCEPCIEIAAEMFADAWSEQMQKNQSCG
jgi:hypothetical protein